MQHIGAQICHATQHGRQYLITTSTKTVWHLPQSVDYLLETLIDIAAAMDYIFPGLFVTHFTFTDQHGKLRRLNQLKLGFRKIS